MNSTVRGISPKQWISIHFFLSRSTDPGIDCCKHDQDQNEIVIISGTSSSVICQLLMSGIFFCDWGQTRYFWTICVSRTFASSSFDNIMKVLIFSCLDICECTKRRWRRHIPGWSAAGCRSLDDVNRGLILLGLFSLTERITDRKALTGGEMQSYACTWLDAKSVGPR